MLAIVHLKELKCLHLQVKCGTAAGSRAYVVTIVTSFICVLGSKKSGPNQNSVNINKSR